MRLSRPRRLLTSAVLAVSLVPATATAAEAACHGAKAGVTAANAAHARSTVRCLLNEVRARHGLRRLHPNGRLHRAAARHSRDMTARHYFDHRSPAGDTLETRVRAAGYLNPRLAWSVAENIGWGTMSLATPQAMVRAWMHSPGHRANILNPSFHDVGVGIALADPQGGRGVTYTTDFGIRH